MNDQDYFTYGMKNIVYLNNKIDRSDIFEIINAVKLSKSYD